MNISYSFEKDIDSENQFPSFFSSTDENNLFDNSINFYSNSFVGIIDNINENILNNILNNNINNEEERDIQESSNNNESEKEIKLKEEKIDKEKKIHFLKIEKRKKKI